MLKFNIKAIMKWELFYGKTFSKFDMTNPDELNHLVYFCETDAEGFTFEIWEKAVKTREQIINVQRELSDNIAYSAQFVKNLQKSTNVSLTEEEQVDDETITSMVSTLIMGGLDANFAMNEMTLYQLPSFIDAYMQNKRTEAENNRLWTYLSILPHVDAKKLKSPVDLLPFPWEEQYRKQKFEEAAPEIEKQLNDFLNGDNPFGAKAPQA